MTKHTNNGDLACRPGAAEQYVAGLAARRERFENPQGYLTSLVESLDEFDAAPAEWVDTLVEEGYLHRPDDKKRRLVDRIADVVCEAAFRLDAFIDNRCGWDDERDDYDRLWGRNARRVFDVVYGFGTWLYNI